MRTKDSHNTILEWITHYIILGFDEIHICDNMSSPPLEEFISIHAPKLLTRINLTFDKNIGFKEQPNYYNSILNNSRHLDWLLCIDDDEFLCLRNNSSLKEFLNNFNNNTAVLSVNWVTFGQGGNKTFDTTKLAMEQFIIRDDYIFFWNYFVKSFIRPKLINFINNFHKSDSGNYESRNVYNELISSHSDRDIVEVEKERNKLNDSTPLVIYHYMTLDNESMKQKHIRSAVRLGPNWKEGQYSEKWYNDSFKDNNTDKSMLKYVNNIKNLIYNSRIME